MKYRYEKFGGIIASEDPPFLAYVDRNYMRELALKETKLWDGADDAIGLLSAPTEVHFAITNKCSVKCPHCYMDAGNEDIGELDTFEMKKALDVLANMGVFHVAMGGGEALERLDLFEVAEYAREIGLVPNLTISGIGLNETLARQLKVFGQVNLSLDAVGNKSGVFRELHNFKIIDKAFSLLKDADVRTGINCVLGRRNFNQLESIFDYAAKKGIEELEFLRYKPAGRGKIFYESEKMYHYQNCALVPKLIKLSEEYKVTAKIDCSFIPMLCYHKPPIDKLRSMATYGCEAGNVLLGIRSNGQVSGCSFLEDTELTVFELTEQYANHHGPLSIHRNWIEQSPEPCKSCVYLSLCKGGCHNVSKAITGSYLTPDPDCPFVVDYNQNF